MDFKKSLNSKFSNKFDIIHFILVIVVIISIFSMAKVSTYIRKNVVQVDYYQQDFEEAVVVEVVEENLVKDEIIENFSSGTQKLIVKILSGKYKGNIYSTTNIIDVDHTVRAKENLKIIVGIREINGEPKVWVYNNKRNNYLYLLVFIFIALLIIFGRKKGVDTVVSLLFTISLLIFILVPLIFKGYNAIILSTITAIIGLLISFLLIGGFDKKTLIATLGSICGIIVSGIIASIFARITNITVINLDKGNLLAYVAIDYKIKIKGIMYASILIASMGAIMDVAMSISTSMNEIYILNPKIKLSALITSGFNIGRDIMGTMSNTLILAFIGGSFSLVLLLWGYNMSFTQISNLPFIAVEVVQGISGSIGIVLTVPFTVLISASFLASKNKKKINRK